MALLTGLKTAYTLLKESALAWVEDDAPSLGAALAFYTVFSLAPVLIVATAVAGLAFGHQAAESELLRQLQVLLGKTGATAVQAIIQRASPSALGVTATAIGVATALAGASGAFVELQSALNKIWKVQRRSGSAVFRVVRERILSFGLVLGLGVLLLVSLVVSAVLGTIGGFTARVLPWPVFVLETMNFILTFGVITLLLALIFKFLPDRDIAWSDVWIGAGLASLLLTTGKALVALYLARSNVASAYAATTCLILILSWVYYSAQIVLLGAEVTHVYASKHGSRHKRHAAAVHEAASSLVRR